MLGQPTENGAIKGDARSNQCPSWFVRYKGDAFLKIVVFSNRKPFCNVTSQIRFFNLTIIKEPQTAVTSVQSTAFVSSVVCKGYSADISSC